MKGQAGEKEACKASWGRGGMQGEAGAEEEACKYTHVSMTCLH